MLLPLPSFSSMYGPVKTMCFAYVDGFSLSYLSAYSFGTGIEIGIASAPASAAPVPLLSLKTIVWSSGVSMPDTGL